MDELEILREVINPSIKISKICLSYIDRLFPEYKDSPCIILHKEKSPEFFNEYSKSVDDETKFDITGSPLKCSFRDVDFEDTLILVKQNWNKKEEKYLPLGRTEACNALNACIEFVTDTFPPIFALCDDEVQRQIRLLGTIVKGEWFTTIKVSSTGIETLESMKMSSSEILQQHSKLSHVPEHDIIISASNTFDIFGIKDEMINWDENAKSNFEGSLSIEVDTCSLSVYAPTRTSKNNLVAQIVTGSVISPLKELWKQLLLLNQYLNIVEEHKKNNSTHHIPVCLQFPDDFTNPYKEEHDTIINNLNLLLNGDCSFRNIGNTEINKMNFINEESIEDNINIEQYIQNLPFRYNLDFTDFLWELIIKNSSYFEMTKCIHTVLEEIIVNECLVQVNFSNSTRFAKVISNPHQQKTITHLLSDSLPLEYVIDMGFEKLYRDYTYILMNAKFSELHDIQQKLGNVSSDKFSVDSYRKKLLCMAQIHVCLEFMLLLQNNLECSADDLRSLLLYASKQYICEKSPIQNCHDLHQNIIYNLIARLPPSAINNFNKEIPNMRRISLSSQTKLSKLTTTKYYSLSPIFPTSTHPLDDTDITDEVYHVTNVICSSNKYK
ncbi:uncharacterized protein LOC143182022 [Calliopsis andreniformis]|uniref:uncharacterized protein LOC143182022 n=1 Tax=Calliopsis andreniformis TaxID=337506 RepID=UPI003FCDB284